MHAAWFSRLCAVVVFLAALPASAQIRRAEKIYRKVSRAVVWIYAYHDNAFQSQASGVILKKQGWIVTNYHVIGNGNFLYALHDGMYVRLDSVVAMDAQKDVLILRIAEAYRDTVFRNMPSLRIRQSADLRVGQKVYAIGNPLGLGNSISEGLIGGLRTTNDSTRKLLQISAPVSQGSSGGAVVNVRGELIGISTLVSTGEKVQNVNFAVIMDDVLAAANGNTGKGDYRKYAGEASLKTAAAEYLAGRYYSSISHYRKALAAGCSESEHLVMYQIGSAFTMAGATDSAIAAFGASLAKMKMAETYISMGNIYAAKEKYGLAESLFMSALSAPGRHAQAYIGLGIIQYLRKDYEKAMQYLGQAVRLDNSNPKAYYYLGRTAEANLDHDNARTYYEAAVTLNPGYAEAWLSLGNVHAKLGNYSLALQYMQKGYALKPELKEGK